MALPPRQPLSRESTIVLDGVGRFWHDGALVEHQGVAKAFARWLGRHPDDGRFVLNNGYDWCYLTVEDTPCFVTRLTIAGERVELELLDGSREPLDPAALWVGDDEVVRTKVRGGAFDARFQRAAQLQLAPLLDGAEPWVIHLGGKRYEIRRE